jgi:hypothetical protein
VEKNEVFSKNLKADVRFQDRTYGCTAPSLDVRSKM